VDLFSEPGHPAQGFQIRPGSIDEFENERRPASTSRRALSLTGAPTARRQGTISPWV